MPDFVTRDATGSGYSKKPVHPGWTGSMQRTGSGRALS